MSSHRSQIFVTELVLPGVARCDIADVRWELFVFSGVRDVLPAYQRDAVLVIHSGRAEPNAWRAVLISGGLTSPGSSGNA